VPEYWIVRPADRDVLVCSQPDAALGDYAQVQHIAPRIRACLAYAAHPCADLGVLRRRAGHHTMTSNVFSFERSMVSHTKEQ